MSDQDGKKTAAEGQIKKPKTISVLDPRSAHAEVEGDRTPDPTYARNPLLKGTDEPNFAGLWRKPPHGE